jgi:hypothetical protein
MAMVPIGIESLMISLLMSNTGDAGPGGTTPPADKYAGIQLPLMFVCGMHGRFNGQGHRQKISKSLPVRGYSIRCVGSLHSSPHWIL